MILKFILLMLIVLCESRTHQDFEDKICVVSNKICKKNTFICGFKCPDDHPFHCGTNNCTNNKKACKLFLSIRVPKTISKKIKFCNPLKSDYPFYYECLDISACDIVKKFKKGIFNNNLF